MSWQSQRQTDKIQLAQLNQHVSVVPKPEHKHSVEEYQKFQHKELQSVHLSVVLQNFWRVGFDKEELPLSSKESGGFDQSIILTAADSYFMEKIF